MPPPPISYIYLENPDPFSGLCCLYCFYYMLIMIYLKLCNATYSFLYKRLLLSLPAEYVKEISQKSAQKIMISLSIGSYPQTEK